MNTPVMSIAKREKELSYYLDKQPYPVELDGIHLIIAKNVFPSDFGITSSFFGHFILQQAPARMGLDMGCGSGYFACLLKKIGCETVLGVDFNKDAVKCATENIKLNPALAPINILHSDLFADVPQTIFDIIIFNFNYYPSNGDFGLNEDGGREILERFFTQVSSYMDDQTRIYIPFSEFVGVEHDPKMIGQAFGFDYEVMATTINETGEHCIYKITK
ncbi:MAG: methyltransferase [Methylococcales bacterium]